MENEDLKICVDEEWINGNTCIGTIESIYERSKAKEYLSKKRKEFVEKLKMEGFEIISNKEEADDNTIFLVMDPTSIVDNNVSLEEYNEKFNKKIFESAGENLNYPVSLKVKEYFDKPFFPAVFKNVLTNGGVDKFLIENMEQLKIIMEFYNKHCVDPKYKKEFDSLIFQQYLETPSKYSTYLRVLVGGNGDALGASLKYSSGTNDKRGLNGLFENVFLNPSSKYFINAKKMFNYYSGGGEISFCQPKYSSEKLSILKSHGFDTANLTLPNEVLDVCRNIMLGCNREIGVLCGIDFMLNKNDGKWYYLENQAFPAIEEWARPREIALPKSHDVNGYLKYLDVELQARYEALMLLVNKKKSIGNDIKTLSLKPQHNK